MLFVKDNTCVILKGNPCSQGRSSKHLIELHYLTDFRNLATIQGRTQKYHIPAPPTPAPTQQTGQIATYHQSIHSFTVS